MTGKITKYGLGLCLALVLSASLYAQNMTLATAKLPLVTMKNIYANLSLSTKQSFPAAIVGNKSSFALVTGRPTQDTLIFLIVTEEARLFLAGNFQVFAAQFGIARSAAGPMRLATGIRQKTNNTIPAYQAFLQGSAKSIALETPIPASQKMILGTLQKIAPSQAKMKFPTSIPRLISIRLTAVSKSTKGFIQMTAAYDKAQISICKQYNTTFKSNPGLVKTCANAIASATSELAVISSLGS